MENQLATETAVTVPPTESAAIETIRELDARLEVLQHGAQQHYTDFKRQHACLIFKKKLSKEKLYGQFPALIPVFALAGFHASNRPEIGTWQGKSASGPIFIGNWKIKEVTLKPQAAKVHALLRHFASYTFTYIPREQNKEADRLVNEALDEAV